jgi:hypothetical protein
LGDFIETILDAGNIKMMAYNDEPSISINNHQPSIVIVYIIVNIYGL